MMRKIKILDESLSNMIAAGEVVENPASIIKELLENSLDAKSNYIRIDINNGGKNIKFFDNGIGMSKDDLLICVERHATSKISTKDDLFNLVTYGFRGEALSSIASVSKMYLASKTEGDSIGNSMNIIASKITNLKEVQKSVGTEIEIKDLFFNTPARLKFLKKESTEILRIKEVVIQEALANPDVSVLLTIDNKEVIRTSGKGLENTVVEIFGISTLKNLKKFEFGYIGNSSITKSTKEYMFTFINGRPVKSKLIEDAIIDAYYTNLVKGKYPFAIINMSISPKDVDVNVHPSKKVVKFSDENTIYHKIYDAVVNSLNGTREFLTPNLEIKNKEKDFDEIDFKKDDENFEKNKINIQTPKFYSNEISENKINEKKNNEYLENFGKNNLDENYISESEKKGFENYESGNKISEKHKFENKIFNSQEERKNKIDSMKIQSFEELGLKNYENKNEKFKIIGQFAKTYILTEEDGQLIIYDQHIIHERILYEQLKKEYDEKNIQSQSLLVPIRLTLSLRQIEILEDKKQLFSDFGFEIDQFNDKEFLIRAVPVIKTSDSFENIFLDLINVFEKRNSRNDIIEEMIITMSCRKAIKANEILSEEDMKNIINKLHKIGRYTCPHGRPINMKIELSDIEKGFKRK